MLIAISGTPGTGKSTLAKILAQKLKFYRLDLSQHYKQLAISYDKKRHCYVVDIKKLISLVKETLKQHSNIIIDSHIAHLLPKKMMDVCIIATCSDLKKLKTRLQKKKYSPAKIKENLEAEIFQVCLMDAREQGHKVLVFDTSKKSVIAIVQKIKQSL